MTKRRSIVEREDVAMTNMRELIQQASRDGKKIAAAEEKRKARATPKGDVSAPIDEANPSDAKRQGLLALAFDALRYS